MNLSGRVRGRFEAGLRLFGAEGEARPFVFDCRIPGTYHFRVIDGVTLSRYLDEGREGDYQEVEGQILWVEPARLQAPI